MTEAPFETHLREAIALNRARRPAYVAAGGLRAGLLSRALVAVERATLPAARRLDRRSAALRRRGVPVLAADLRPMRAAPPVRRLDAGPPPSGTAGVVRSVLRAAARLWRRADDLADAEALAGEVVRGLGPAPGGADPWWPLTRHLAESACLAARNGQAYDRQTAGASRPVTAAFVRLHAAGLPAALLLDRAAWPLRRRGVGLFALDVPAVFPDGALSAPARRHRP